MSGLFGGSDTIIETPDPIDIRKSIGDYIDAVSDPALRDQILGAERTDRPQFRALDLQDINTILSGIQAGQANPEYQRIQSEIAALEAGGQASGRLPNKKELEAEAAKQFPMTSGRDRRGFPVNRGRVSSKQRKAIEAQRANYIEQRSGGRDARSTARAEELASLRSRLANTPKTLGATKGLLDLQDEASRRAGITTREALALQRADDLRSFQDLSRGFVDASRAADPESTRLAEMASARAGQETGLGARGRGLLGSQVQAASAAERQLQEMGMTLGDLSPTEQEALISGRGTEFIQSTGELSPLEQRRAQQASRQASLARGREMGQGSFYDEMLARQAEELNKQERQVALGSQLLGQEAGMRGERLGQGAGMLQGSEALAAQRRLEQLQRMELGAGFIGQEEGIQSGRFGQAFSMNRALAGDLGAAILGRPSYATQLGSQTLGAAQQGAQQSPGPKLYDSNMGLNMAMMDQQNQFGLLGAQAQANATQSANKSQMVGQIAAAAIGCWVAREVYGIENPKWIQFRNWMLNDSPSWFRNLYIKYGERFAKFISNKPALKNIIRKWMNTKIK